MTYEDGYILYKQGYTLAEVGKAMGVTRQSVYDCFKRRGFAVRDKKLLLHMTKERTRKLFLKKVGKTKDCWIWNASQIPTGYGRFKSKTITNSGYAHRASWLIYNGEIPPGMCVLHKCDNPSCVNPKHLFLGTMTDNMRDRDNKGRTHRGQRHTRVAPNIKSPTIKV